MNRLRLACKKFARQTGVAVLAGEEDVSVMRWLGAGALSKEQKLLLNNIYERIGNE